VASVKVPGLNSLRVLGTVDGQGNVSPSTAFHQFVRSLLERTGGDTDAVDGAQTTGDNAQHSMNGDPSSYIWNADAAGTFPGDDTADLTMNVEDKDGTNVATRVLRGSFVNATEVISVTNVSSTGLTTSYVVANDASESVRADVTVTFADGTQSTSSLSWSVLDPSVSGGTPGSGGPK